QADDGMRDFHVTGVQMCALPISFTSGWLSPLFTLLILRLGYWLPHPDHVRVRWLPQLPGARYILKEALGLVNVKSKFVNVSDGRSEERRVGKYGRLSRWRSCEYT